MDVQVHQKRRDLGRDEALRVVGLDPHPPIIRLHVAPFAHLRSACGSRPQPESGDRDARAYGRSRMKTGSQIERYCRAWNRVGGGTKHSKGREPSRGADLGRWLDGEGVEEKSLVPRRRFSDRSEANRECGWLSYGYTKPPLLCSFAALLLKLAKPSPLNTHTRRHQDCRAGCTTPPFPPLHPALLIERYRSLRFI